jgi:hypothetical protein
MHVVLSVDENRPVAQLLQASPASLVWPSGQALHLSTPGTLEVNPEEQAMQDVAPVVLM